MSEIKFLSMTDEDILYYLPNARLVLYDELKNKKIEKLLQKHKSYIILLYPVISEMNGHWYCLTRFNSTIEYFSSYGTVPDVEFNWPTSKFQDHPRYLSEILNKSKLRVVYNDIAFQSMKNGISTCGAYTVFRILTLLELNADLGKNNLLLQTLKQGNPEMSFDDIVVEYINKR